ncbi:MAG TPA: class I SAM-dependent methyltransferase [Candidatus Binataceae bacterium]|nr:class I SAM-dependent methyltransferase [Candidatus Binataceae bacterium]
MSSTVAWRIPTSFVDLLASPCHRARLASAGEGGPLKCTTCGRLFGAHHGVYDLRIAKTSEIAFSFDHQWRRYHQGDFERATLYGADSAAEVANFLRAMDCVPEAIHGRWILDAGCGSGRLAKSLAELGANVVGLDLSGEVRRLGVSAPSNLNFVQADLMHPPFWAGSFDMVWSMGVLHHTGAPRRGFEQLASLVAPGGSLAVWVYSARRRSVFLGLRRWLPMARGLPEAQMRRLCGWLAWPLFMGGVLAPLVGRKPLSLATIRFGLYDSLGPRYQSRHSTEEVLDWYRALGFSQMRVWSAVGVCGTRG